MGNYIGYVKRLLYLDNNKYIILQDQYKILAKKVGELELYAIELETHCNTLEHEIFLLQSTHKEEEEDNID
jgi:hypothetical protein